MVFVVVVVVCREIVWRREINLGGMKGTRSETQVNLQYCGLLED